MENAESVLVIILSTVLAIDLLLMLVALVVIIKIANRVKRVVEKAEAISDKAESFVEFFSKAGTPLAFAKVFSTVTDAFKTGKRRRSKNDR